LLVPRVEDIARVLKCPLWASCRVRVEVRGDINSTLLQKPMDVSQFWRRYWLRKVKFNGEEFNVYQAIDNFRDKYFTKDVYV
jgi:hypothetical protein